MNLPRLNKKPFKLAAGILILYFLDAWLLGSFAVMLYNYKKGLNLFHNPLQAVMQIPQAGVSSMWLFLNILTGLFILMLAGFIYIRFPEVADKFRTKKLTFTDDPTAGTSRWMSTEEVRKNFKLGYGPGILLGSYDGQPLRLHGQKRLNKNVFVLGGPGTGKTVSKILPACLQAIINNESVIITDPKGENARTVLGIFKKYGYNVKVFNLVEMFKSDRWNTLNEVTTDLEAQLFTQVVIANTAVPGIKKMGGDPFWDRAEQNLLKALTMYIKNERPKEKQNIPELYKLLTGGDLDMLDLAFNGLPENHPAKAPYNIFSQAKAKADIVQGLAIRLQVFQSEEVKKLTETSDMDLEAPGREKCAYFCILPDTDSTFEFLSSLFFTFLFIKLTKLGDKGGGQCPVNINFLLDEFCNIGAIPDFKKRIATMRSRGISCEIITQSLPQLRNRYPLDEWQEIMSCCDTRLFLGVNDNDTAKYLSETLGEGTIEQFNIRRHTKDLLHVQVGKTPTRRALLKLDETLRLDEKEAVLIVRGRHPLKIEKLSYQSHPLAGELVSQKILEYVPSWREEPLPEIEIDWGEATIMEKLPTTLSTGGKKLEETSFTGDSTMDISEDDLLSRFKEPEPVPEGEITATEVKHPIKGWF